MHIQHKLYHITMKKSMNLEKNKISPIYTKIGMKLELHQVV